MSYRCLFIYWRDCIVAEDETELSNQVHYSSISCRMCRCLAGVHLSIWQRHVPRPKIDLLSSHSVHVTEDVDIPHCATDYVEKMTRFGGTILHFPPLFLLRNLLSTFEHYVQHTRLTCAYNFMHGDSSLLPTPDPPWPGFGSEHCYFSY